MYQITADGYILHDLSLGDPALALTAATLTQEANAAPALNFTMEHDHARYNHLDRFTSVIEVFDDGVRIFRGRILDDKRVWDNAKTFLCEGDLAALNDSRVRPYEYTGGVTEYLKKLIGQHNEQVTKNKRFTVRRVTVTDPNDYITRGASAYPTTWQEISEKLVGLLGGYLMLEYDAEADINYIDYLEDSPYETTQHITFGVNLLDFTEENRGADIVTALIPLGATIEAETNEDDSEDYTEPANSEQEKRVTIESVNGGRDYIKDAEAIERYGLIFGTETWDDVHEPLQLLNKGKARLAELVRGWNSIELSAADLSHIDKTVDDFRIMEYVRVDDPAHGLNTKLLVRRLTLDLLDPTSSDLVIGEEVRGITDYLSTTEKRVEKISRDYVVNEQIKSVVQQVVEASSMIQQMSDSIMLQVNETYVGQSEYEQKLQQLMTQIKQTSSDITFSFEQLTERINNISGDTQAQFSETSKYIRFVDGKIIIGQEGDPMTIEISKNALNFLQKGVVVAYITDNKLMVYDGNFLNSLQLGRFAFVPRASGNLSFLKVM